MKKLLIASALAALALNCHAQLDPFEEPDPVPQVGLGFLRFTFYRCPGGLACNGTNHVTMADYSVSVGRDLAVWQMAPDKLQWTNPPNLYLDLRWSNFCTNHAQPWIAGKATLWAASLNGSYKMEEVYWNTNAGNRCLARLMTEIPGFNVEAWKYPVLETYFYSWQEDVPPSYLAHWPHLLPPVLTAAGINLPYVDLEPGTYAVVAKPDLLSSWQTLGTFNTSTQGVSGSFNVSTRGTNVWFSFQKQ